MGPVWGGPVVRAAGLRSVGVQMVIDVIGGLRMNLSELLKQAGDIIVIVLRSGFNVFL
jgi:hypothetical protein